MKIYILIEQVFLNCENPYFEVLGVFKDVKNAQIKQEKTINDNIKNYNFVIDEQDKNIIFLDYQENWDNYIEYKIIKKEIK